MASEDDWGGWVWIVFFFFFFFLKKKSSNVSRDTAGGAQEIN